MTIKELKELAVYTAKGQAPTNFSVENVDEALRDGLKKSPLYASNAKNAVKVPSWIKVDKNAYTIDVLSLPQKGEIEPLADLLKVIEFYARA